MKLLESGEMLHAPLLRLAMQAAACLLLLLVAAEGAPAADPARATPGALAWPASTQTARPWTRWWWHGSAVDKENLSRQLAAYRDAGLGGVEITCIYGVRGEEARDLPYLSTAWIEAMTHALEEARRLGLGVDLPTGSGWRMGGPSVPEADADLKLVLAGDPLAIGTKWAGDPVKRAAPGGEGRSINPYSKRAVTDYLAYFAKATDKLPEGAIRAQFHDSFEYDGDWCDDFLAEFAARRGYRLEDHLPALAGRGDSDLVARVKCDYRETLSDLVRDNFILPWVEWSHAHGMLARNQAHGSPANWLDLYAACDIPETESFGRLVGGDTDPLVFRFASSAAHVAGRPLVSCETATWLDEHFHVTLGQIKEIVDRQFFAGVNHVIYHGTAYSPQDAVWPGWVFYASTQLNPQNPIWRDLPALNQYVTRCQSMLQSTRPDNDILLYWPIHDAWHDPTGLRKDMQVHNAAEWFTDTPFGRAAAWLEEHGYTFDYVSDRQLGECRVVDDKIQTPGASYQTVLVPGAEHMPAATLKALLGLAEAGATVGFLGGVPSGPPGLVADQQQAEWNDLMARLKFVDRTRDQQSSKSWLQEMPLGRGRVMVSADWAAVLIAADVRREYFGPPPTSFGGQRGLLRFHRRVTDDGQVYFMKNESDEPFDDWISPTGDWTAAAIMDPLDGRTGLAAVRAADDGGRRQLRLQLVPGQAVFVKLIQKPIEGSEWEYCESAGQPIELAGRWSVEFVEGGPELPDTLATSQLKSWTELAGAGGQRFAGTARYALTFDAPVEGQHWLLSLGRVADSARVELNGRPVATRFAPPYEVEVGPLLPTGNQLVVEVTNVAANRIRDLDRRQVLWRKFYDINFVNIDYGAFDASGWPIRDAGLLGPVTVTPLKASPGL